jgi:hypothetical protein
MTTSFDSTGKNGRPETRGVGPLSTGDSPAINGGAPLELNHGPANKDGTPLTTWDTENKGGTPLTSGEVPAVKGMGPLISPTVNHGQNFSLNAQNDLDGGAAGVRTQKRNIDDTLLPDSSQGLSKAMDELSGDEEDPHASPSKKRSSRTPSS